MWKSGKDNEEDDEDLLFYFKGFYVKSILVVF